MNEFKEIIEKQLNQEVSIDLRDKWLSELENQWNAKIISGIKALEDQQLSEDEKKRFQHSFAMKIKNSKEHISAIFFGADKDAALWNMLNTFLDEQYLYAKIKDNNCVAIFYP